MTQDINLNDTDESPTETRHTFPKSNETDESAGDPIVSDIGDFGPVEVVMPDGTAHLVDPGYDIIVAVNGREFYDDFGTNMVHRIEIETDETDHKTIMDAVEGGMDLGLGTPRAPEDPMLTKVYLRDVFDEKQLCIELTAPHRDGNLSTLAEHIRAACANQLA